MIKSHAPSDIPAGEFQVLTAQLMAELLNASKVKGSGDEIE